MAAAITALLPDNSTDANFRAWGSWISGRFTANGWVQTADTGQINWTTVTHPTTTSASQGFEIWKTGDAVGTTFYLKIEYGSNATSASIPGLFLTMGTGSNGSGTLTGQLGTSTQIYGTTTSSTTYYPCVSGGGTAWFSLEMFVGGATTMGFVLERTKDSNGNDNTVGFVTISHRGTSAFHQTIPATGTIWSQDGIIPTPWNRGSSMISGTVIGLEPVIPIIQTSYPAMLGVVGYFSSDIGNNVSFTVSRYGSNHTYYAPGAFWVSSSVSLAGAIRYE